MTLSIHWLIGKDYPALAAAQSSPVASIRLRAGVAGEALVRAGAQLTVGSSLDRSPRVLVVGKANDQLSEERRAHWLEAMRRVRAAGGKVILDFTDYDESHSWGAFYRDAFTIADAMVCPSAQMARNARKEFPHPIEIIEDPIEVTARAPKLTHHTPITALWFGHYTNLRYLADFLHRFPRSFHLRLIALCNDKGVKDITASLPAFPAHLTMEPRLWSVETMIAAAAEADLCVIPSDPKDPRKNGASSNRLITAFALGLPTVASVIDAYQEFSDYFVDLNAPDVMSVFADPTQLRDRVLAAQATVCPRFERHVLGGKWRDLLMNMP